MESGGFQSAPDARSGAGHQGNPRPQRGVIQADGSRKGWRNFTVRPTPSKMWRTILAAQLLGLMVAFIGEKLTLHLVREIWPEVPLDDLDLANGSANGDIAKPPY